jgi:Putative bacterial sensory transduction regulator
MGKFGASIAKRAGRASGFALALALISGAAAARDLPAEGFTLDDVVAWLQSVGYKTQKATSADGSAHVMTATSSGIKFGVYMFDCKGERCGSFQFSAGFATHGSFNTARMNDWNRDNRWARGYFDKINDPWVEMDVDLTPGGTYELLNDELETWQHTVVNFAKVYGLQ